MLLNHLKISDAKMVWFDASLRFQLCETGISGTKNIPTSVSSISGFTAGVE